MNKFALVLIMLTSPGVANADLLSLALHDHIGQFCAGYVKTSDGRTHYRKMKRQHFKPAFSVQSVHNAQATRVLAQMRTDIDQTLNREGLTSGTEQACQRVARFLNTRAGKNVVKAK